MASSSRVTADDVRPVFLGGQDLDLDDDGRDDDPSDSSSSTENVADTSQAVQRAPEANDCESKTHYLSVPSGEAKKVLFAMCLGLCAEKDPDDPTAIRYLSEFNVEPYLSVKNKKPFRPMHKHLLDEIQRRFEVLKIPAEKRFKRHDKQKASMNAARTWLIHHPVTNQKDVLFLQAEEEKFFSILDMARIESRTIASTKASAGTSGIVLTRTAVLRLIHCIIEDNVRETFLRRHDLLQRDGLDARNAPGRPPTWNQLIANKFNDPNFQAVTEVFSELHSDFGEEISINRSDCPNNITPEQVDFWVTDRKSKLLTVQRRYHLFGNGEGSRQRDIGSDNASNTGDGDDEDDGDNLEYLPDNRAAFLQTEGSTILYQWEMFEKYNILDSLLSVLPNDLGVSSNTLLDFDGDTTGSARRKRRRRQNDDRSLSPLSGMTIQNNQVVAMTSMVNILQSMAASRSNSTKATTVANARAALASASEAVENAERTVLSMTEKLADSSNPLVKTAYEERIQRAQQRLVSAEERYAEAEEAYRLAKE
jgi:hypothetical protein